MSGNVKGNLESEIVVQTILFQHSLLINLKLNNCFGTPWWQSLRECCNFSQYLQFCNLFDWDNVCCTCSSMKTFCLQHINKKNKTETSLTSQQLSPPWSSYSMKAVTVRLIWNILLFKKIFRATVQLIWNVFWGEIFFRVTVLLFSKTDHQVSSGSNHTALITLLKSHCFNHTAQITLSLGCFGKLFHIP